jgi:valyl-tRNA synthetase
MIYWCPSLQSTISDQEVNNDGPVPTCSRTGDILKSIMKEQWFLRCDEMHRQAAATLATGHPIVQPKLFDAHLFEWFKHDQPWCLSRQLAWGHRIPAYYDG